MRERFVCGIYRHQTSQLPAKNTLPKASHSRIQQNVLCVKNSLLRKTPNFYKHGTAARERLGEGGGEVVQRPFVKWERTSFLDVSLYGNFS